MGSYCQLVVTFFCLILPNQRQCSASVQAGADPESGKRGGGHLAEKVEEQKKKVITIIASYPLPNILYHVCKILFIAS